MSEEVDRQLEDVRAALPRPRPNVTEAVERRVLERFRSLTSRRQFRAGALGGVVGLLAGAVLGAAIVTAAGAATDVVTLAVRPTILSGTDATAIGSVSNGRAGEEVVFETRECGQSHYRVFLGTTTRENGVYDENIGSYIWINGFVRARWKGAYSEPINIRRRATVGLQPLGGGRYRAIVGGQKYFDGKRVRVERWNASTRRWRLVRRLVLRRFAAAGVFVSSAAETRLRVPNGVQLRAVFPIDQARPCYAAGTSKIVRVGSR